MGKKTLRELDLEISELKKNHENEVTDLKKQHDDFKKALEALLKSMTRF